MINEDSRRYLIDLEMPGNPVWRLKILVAKQSKTKLGGHYHKQKTEMFKLVEGHGMMKTRHSSNHEINEVVLELGKLYFIHPYTVHEFVLDQGSILICVCDKHHDPNDDYSESI